MKLVKKRKYNVLITATIQTSGKKINYVMYYTTKSKQTKKGQWNYVSKVK